MTATTPNPKREKPLKVPMNDQEHQQLRQFCTSIGRHVAPFIRELAFAHIRAQANRTPEKRKSEWPRHGHVQRFPGRAAVAGGFKRLHL